MLQEMIDSDIKAEFDDVMTSNQLGFTNVDSLDLLNNLDDLETPFKFDSRYHGVDEVLKHDNDDDSDTHDDDVGAEPSPAVEPAAERRPGRGPQLKLL